MAAARRAENAIIEPEWKWALTADPHFDQYTSVASICFDRQGDVLLSVTRQDASGQVFLASIMRQPRSHPRRMPPQFCHLFGEQFRATDRPSWYTNLVCYRPTGAIYAFEQASRTVVRLRRDTLEECEVSVPLNCLLGEEMHGTNRSAVQLEVCHERLMLRSLASNAILWLSLCDLTVDHMRSRPASSLIDPVASWFCTCIHKYGCDDAFLVTYDSSETCFPRYAVPRVEPLPLDVSMSNLAPVLESSYGTFPVWGDVNNTAVHRSLQHALTVATRSQRDFSTTQLLEQCAFTNGAIPSDFETHFLLHHIDLTTVPSFFDRRFPPEAFTADALLIPRSKRGTPTVPRMLVCDNTTGSLTIAVVYDIVHESLLTSQCVATFTVPPLNMALQCAIRDDPIENMI